MVRNHTIPNPRLKVVDYPDVLYRIHFPDTSHTSYDDNYGFRCTATGRIQIRNYNHLAAELRDHLDWYSGEPSYFISMFGREDHAINWARKQLRRGNADTAYIMDIDPYEIKNADGTRLPILQMGELLEQYPGLLPDGLEKEWFDDEFLALYRIPDEAITKTRRVL